MPQHECGGKKSWRQYFAGLVGLVYLVRCSYSLQYSYCIVLIWYFFSEWFIFPFYCRCFSIVEKVVERGHIRTSPTQETGKFPKNLGGSTVRHSSSSGSSNHYQDQPVMQEMVMTAGCVHSVLVLPWYSRVSPDVRYSYQVCCYCSSTTMFLTLC